VEETSKSYIQESFLLHFGQAAGYSFMLTPHRKHIQMLHWRQCQLAPVILRPQRQQGLVRHASDIVSSFQKGVFRDFEATTNGKVERRVKQILVPEAILLSIS